jgi:hypothetical protein
MAKGALPMSSAPALWVRLFDALQDGAYQNSVRRDQPAAILCCAHACSQLASLIHSGKPYCGRHALDLLEAGEQPDTPASFRRSALDPRADVTGQPPEEQGNEKSQFDSKATQMLAFAKIGNEETNSDQEEKNRPQRNRRCAASAL